MMHAKFCTKCGSKQDDKQEEMYGDGKQEEGTAKEDADELKARLDGLMSGVQGGETVEEEGTDVNAESHAPQPGGITSMFSWGKGSK